MERAVRDAWIIREAVPADAPGIARVHVESWRTTYAGLVPEAYIARHSHEKREAQWTAHLSDAGAADFTFVAVEPGGGIVGFAVGCPERTGDPVYRGELGGIYLLKEAQQRGIGRRLVSHVARRLIERGYASMKVWTLTENPARRFYEALGGVELERKPIEMGETLEQVAYGWIDATVLVPPDGRGTGE